MARADIITPLGTLILRDVVHAEIRDNGVLEVRYMNGVVLVTSVIAPGQWISCDTYEDAEAS